MPENGQNGQNDHWHAVLKGGVILRQKAKFEPDYCTVIPTIEIIIRSDLFLGGEPCTLRSKFPLREKSRAVRVDAHLKKMMLFIKHFKNCE